MGILSNIFHKIFPSSHPAVTGGQQQTSPGSMQSTTATAQPAPRVVLQPGVVLPGPLRAAGRVGPPRPPPQPWAQMHKVKAPTLLTWGRDDRVSPLDMALIPMRTIANAELHVFPNCGHWAMIEAKEAFEQTVLGFLQR